MLHCHPPFSRRETFDADLSANDSRTGNLVGNRGFIQHQVDLYTLLLSLFQRDCANTTASCVSVKLVLVGVEGEAFQEVLLARVDASGDVVVSFGP